MNFVHFLSRVSNSLGVMISVINVSVLSIFSTRLNDFVRD